MAPRQKGPGGWGLDLLDRRIILQQLTALTPGSSHWLLAGAAGDEDTKRSPAAPHSAHHSNPNPNPNGSVLDHANPFRREALESGRVCEEALFDPLRNLGNGHRAGQALLELSIGEALSLTLAETLEDAEGGGAEAVARGLLIDYGEEEHRRGRAALAYMLQVRPAFPPFPPYMAHAFFLLETGIVPVRPPIIKHDPKLTRPTRFPAAVRTQIGEWGTGVSVAMSLGAQCRQTLSRIEAAQRRAHDAAHTTLLTVDNQGPALQHELALRGKRQTALISELVKAHEKMQQVRGRGRLGAQEDAACPETFEG